MAFFMTKKKFIVLPTIQHEVRRWLQTLLNDCRQDMQFAIQLSVTEVVQNIYRYAYKNQDGGAIDIEFSSSDETQTLTITLRDYGEPARPEQFMHKTHRASEQGGMGLNLIRQNSASFAITPLADGNLAELTFLAPS